MLMSEGHGLGFYLVKNIAMVSIQIAIVYLNWFWLFPTFFQQKKYILYGILSFGLLYSLFVLSFSWIELVVNGFHQLIPNISPIDFPPISWKYPFWVFLSNSAPYSLSLISSLALKIYYENQQNQALASALKIEQAKTEIQYLRSQINPHLVFNALNNIHTLILIHPKKAADYTILLSDLLRYMLYEVKKDQTSLANELMCLNNYFHLVQMRIEETAQLKKVVNLKNEDLSIVPLLLLSIVENGVKHSGIMYLPNAHLSLNIKSAANQLSLRMENTIIKKHSNTDTGIGLNNLKKRLNINYPNQHTFTFEVAQGIAYTRLNLILPK